NVGNAGSQAGIQARIDVSNSPVGGYTALTVDNSASTGRYAAVISESAVSFALIGGVRISYTQNDLRSLMVHGSNQTNAYLILNTPQSSVPGGLTTPLSLGTTNDTVYVEATTGALSVNGGAGNDFVHVGSSTNDVQSIRGTVTLQNAGGQTVLNVN